LNRSRILRGCAPGATAASGVSPSSVGPPGPGSSGA